MILQSFILGSLCREIINSVFMVGLYYGFLTTFSIGPSYLLHLRTILVEKGEEGAENKVAATMGFIMGQLMMFLSIYYTPLHLALDRPHTITALTIPCLFFYFLWNNRTNFFDYDYGYGFYVPTYSNSIRNLRIQSVFLHNFIFQLLNHFIFPSAILTRLVNIYMFRCNHKILFLISSFLGWLVGHLLFLKLVDLIGFGVEQYNLIMYKRYRYIRNNKYFVAKMCYTKDRIFSILLFITFLYNLGRIRFPILNRIMQDPYTMEFDEDRFPFLKEEIEEEIILPGEGGELNFEGIKSSLEYVEEEIDDDNYEKEILKGRKPLAPFEFEQTFLFDFRLWVRPLVYRDDAAKLEASQYFFYPCQSDGKERISFTYPPSLSTFWKMIERKMSLFTIEKPLSDDLCDHWSYTNEQKKNNLSTEFRKRIEALGKKRSSLRNVLEKRIRLDKRMKINYFNLYLNILSSQNVILSSSLAEETQKKDYLPNQYDPLLAGPRRTKIKEPFSYLAQPTYTYKNQKNKIFNLLFKSKKRELYLEPKEIPGKYSFTSIYVDAEELDLRKGIRKMIYKYFDDVEYAQGVSGPHIVNEYQIRTRKFKPIIWYTYDGKDIEKGDRNYLPGVREMFWLEYSRLRKDIKRELIIGSMPNLRRKSDSFNLAQIRLHSTLFLTEVKSYLIFVLEVLFEFLVIPIYKLLLFILTKGKMQKNKDDEAEEYAIGEVTFSLENLEKLEGRKGQELLELPDEYYYISDEYDPFLDEASYYPSFRALVLLAHVVLRKYILFPSLIIVKNLVRILFHEPPEWSEDFADLKKEVYVICDHEGKAASHTEWPKEWLTDGIEIKVFFPFTLKPWHNKEYDKVPKEDVCFLNILGMETEYIYGRPRKKPPFLKPVLKELKKKIRKWKNKLKSFVLKLSLKKGTESFPNVSKETKERERSELSETKKEKDLIMSNQMIDESSVPIEFRDSIDYSFTEPKMIDESSVPIEILDLDLIVDYSLTEQEMKNLTNRTSTIRNQIDKMRKFQEELLLTPEVNIISSNKPSFPQKLVPSIKKILQKLKRRNARLMHKFYYFIRYLMQRIYIDIIVRIVLIFQLNTVLFYKNFYKFFLKYVSPCTNKLKKPRKFISIIQNSLSYIKNENSKILCDLSSLSQAYVFYKLYQTRLIKLSELRYALQYHGTSLFLKNEIKDFFEAEEIFHSELKHKNLLNSGMKQWKNWLRIHYQYDLSPIRWYHLVPQKWRTKVNQQRMDENKDLNKGDSDEKTDQLIHSKKLNDFEANSLSNKNYYNFQKWYRYDLFSSKSINYEDKKDSYIYVPPPCINKKKEDISYNYNIYKRRIFDLPEGFLGFKNFEGFMSFKIPIGQFSIMNPEIFPDRKYFDGMLFPFCLKNKVDIESWIDIETNDSQNITPRVNKNRVNKNYQLFDWMRMNEKILSHPTSTHHHPLWFLPEVVPRYKKYKKRLWTIRTKFLLFNSNGYVTFMENINLENLYMETYPYNMKKDVLRKRVKKKTTKKDFNISVDAQQDCVEEGYPYCQVFSDLDDILEAYIERDTVVLKLKKKHRKRSALAFLRGESVDLDFTEFRGELVFRQWKSQGVIDVEGIATTRHNKEQFIIYQMINIALLHKSKSPWPLLHKPKRTPKNPPRYIHAENYVWSIWLKERKKKKREKNYSDLFAPEKILSTKRRRELRILISFYSKNGNVIQKNPVFCKYVKNCGEVLDKSKKEKKKIKKLKLFLWPNYRLEDLACMNRYWFHTNNSSRFSMLRLYMYPPLFRLLRLPWANPYTFSI